MLATLSSAQGHDCPQFVNPADFMMKLINDDFEDAPVDQLVQAWKDNKEEQMNALQVAESPLQDGKEAEERDNIVATGMAAFFLDICITG